MRTLSLFAGAAIVILWGIAHIAIPTRSVVEGFGPISADNKRILLMEWLMEGVLLVFIGVLVLLVASLVPELEGPAMIVYRVCASVLIVMAGISLFTGARTASLPMKLCPPILFTVAALFFLISTNVQPTSSRGEPVGGANYRQGHKQENGHGDESDTVSARYESVGVV